MSTPVLDAPRIAATQPVAVPAASRPGRELLLLAVAFTAYSAARLLASDDLTTATSNAQRIVSLESGLHLHVEAAVNALLSGHRWAEAAAALWYASLHYLITPLALMALWRNARPSYRRLRTVLLTATGVALIMYVALPAAPPRLSGGYTDTLAATSWFGWWGANASAPQGLGGLTNELAAMRSMHVGWAVWVALAVQQLTPSWRYRAVGWSYAAITFVVVVATANHWVLDGVAGAALVLITWAVTAPRGGQVSPKHLSACAQEQLRRIRHSSGQGGRASAEPHCRLSRARCMPWLGGLSKLTTRGYGGSRGRSRIRSRNFCS